MGGVFGGFHMFNFLTAIFPIFFIVVFGIIIYGIFRDVSQWRYNSRQPVLTVNAKVVSKRTRVSGSAHHNNDGLHHHAHTAYYTTFEVESGDRMELPIPPNEFGYLAEGDIGRLTFQGTRFHSFVRERMPNN